jgi:hypothetical protein
MTKRSDVYNVTIEKHSSQSEKPKVDSVVQTIVERFESRAAFGRQKYGTDLDRTDLSVLDWIQHIQDELHDGILYLEKLKQVLNGKVEEPNK